MNPQIPQHRNRIATVLLVLSGLGLWGSTAVVAGEILFGGRGDAAITKLFDVLTFAVPMAAAGVVLLALYAVVQKPWQEGRGSLAFVLQTPFALGVLLIAFSFGRDMYR